MMNRSKRAAVAAALTGLLMGSAQMVAPAAAASTIAFVGAAHSDPAAQKFKQASVPVQAQTGDSLVMVFTRASSVTWTGPSGITGWSQVDSSSNGTVTSTIYRKTTAASDPGAAVRFDTATYAKALLSVAVYRGADTAAPLVVSNSADAVSATSHVSPTATAADGDWVASYWVDRSVTTTDWSAPAATTPRDVVIGTGASHYSGVLADSGGPVSAGTYGALTAVSTPATKALMWTIVLSAGGSPAVNQPPTAAFSSSCSALSCSFDGTGSSDPDGTVTSYAWDFGDGTGSSLPAPPHVYTRAGTYNVTLVVTDDKAATGSTSTSVTVSDATASGIRFVGATHSDPASAKFKSAIVPLAAATGDTALMTLTRATTVTWTGPSGVNGWTQLSSAAANGLTSTVWSKHLTANDPGASVRFDTGTYAKAILTVAVYSGLSQGDPVQATFRSEASATTTHVTPAVSPAQGDWVASFWMDKSDTTTSWTAGTDATTRDVAIGTGTGHYSALIADSGGPLAGGGYPGRSATTDVATKALMWSVLLPGGQTAPPSPVSKLMVIMEENRTTSAYEGMPYLTALSNTYGKATAYKGLTHPSEGNYIAIISGQGATTCGLTNPLPTACPQPGGTVFGQALGAGKTAKTYAESMTSNCQLTNSTLYAVRHNPWVYFASEATPCSSLDVTLETTPSGALATDIDSGQLPNVSMVVPNLMNDAHDGTLQQADDWLASWMPRLMAGPDYQQGRLAIVITFDEGVGSNQNIPFVLVHPAVSQVVVPQPYDHYGLTRFYDDVLGVAPLNAAATEPGLKASFGL